MRGFACAALVIALLGEARGEGTGVIAVSPDRAAVAEAVAAAIGPRRIARDAIAEARAAIAAGAVPIDELARFRRVREAIDEGWDAFQRVAIELARQRLTTARTEAEQLVALPGGAETYADAALKLGAVLGHQKRTAEALAVIRLALALDPERPITLAEFSPDVMELVAQAKAQQPAMHPLEVITSPPGAVVSVDGKDRGRSPLVVDVERGQHVVTARLPEHRAAVQGVAIEGASKLELVVERDGAAARLATLAEQEPLVGAVLTYADLDDVVIVAETSRRGGLALLGQRCAGAPVRCSAVVDIGFEPGGRAAAARVLWEAVRAGELRYPPTVLAERATRVVTPRCKLCRSPWLWGGVGAALITGAIVAIVVTSASKPPPVVTVDPGVFLP